VTVPLAASANIFHWQRDLALLESLRRARVQVKCFCCTFTGLPDVQNSRSSEYRDWEHKSIAFVDALQQYPQNYEKAAQIFSLNLGFSTFLGFPAFLLSLHKRCLVEGASADYYLN